MGLTSKVTWPVIFELAEPLMARSYAVTPWRLVIVRRTFTDVSSVAPWFSKTAVTAMPSWVWTVAAMGG